MSGPNATGPAVAAGLLYGALAFAAGGVLGPLREMLLAPAIGGLPAALAEAAAMVLLLWLAARYVVVRLPAPSRRARGIVAAVALAVVIGCEFGLGLALEASGLAGTRAPRDLGERLVGLPLLLWLAVLPFLVQRRAVAVP